VANLFLLQQGDTVKTDRAVSRASKDRHSDQQQKTDVKTRDIVPIAQEL